MTTGKLCLAALLGAMPAIASAQPSVSVGINVGVDNFDTVAPGDPVESVDVFYDQLSPYGAWVDEPDVGRVYIPDTAGYVPYTAGHWEYTNVGFVWISTEPHAWATSHYGRWAFSNYYGRWYWLPDTEWGPAWVEWRQTGADFGWAPLPPEIVVRAGWQPPVESWHYCSAEHVLDPNLTRFYEPRERVVAIHREARPIEHYSTISNVKVVVGPPAATLREHRVAVHPVRVQARTVGRWTAPEAHAQVERAREHRTTFEVQNQRHIESNAKLHTAQVKVIEAHPQIKAQVTARVQGRPEPARPNEPARTPERKPNEPARVEPARPNQPARVEPNRPNEPARTNPERKPNEPARVEPNRPNEPARQPNRPSEPAHVAPKPPEHAPAVAPKPVERTPEQRTPAQRPEPNAREQRPTIPPNRPVEQPVAPKPEAAHREPEPKAPERAQPQRNEPPRAAPRQEPDRKEPERKPPPERKEPDRKDDRKEPDHR